VDLRELMVDLLRDRGYQAFSAGNGREALAMARAHRPDLIVLDLLMPIMNGWQFREAQLREPSLARIPVVVVSDHAEHLKGAPYLRKPARIEHVLDAVHRYAN